MARAGVSDVYSESNDLLQLFLCIEVATTQVFRVTNAALLIIPAKAESRAW